MSMEYCRQRKGWERDGRKDFEGDWTCFKVNFTCILYISLVLMTFFLLDPRPFFLHVVDTAVCLFINVVILM